MRIRTKGRTGPLLAAALLAGFAASRASATDKLSILPSDIAQAHAKPGQSTPKHVKSSAHLTTSPAAPGKAAQKASAIPQVAPAFPADRRDALDIPPSVANANAQLGSTQAARNAMPLQAEPTADANGPAVAADSMPGPGAATPGSQGMPALDQLAAAGETVVSASAASGTQASLIGSICIGIGALLSMASAARLYIAS
jgi:hypothetical protein